MIKSLGFQKVLIIFLLVLGLGAIYFFGIMGLAPKTESLERQLRSERSTFNETSEKLSNLRMGVEKFEVQKDKFLNLQTLGFFDAQDRVDLTRRLDNIGQESGVLSATYNISPIMQEANQKAEEAGYQILLTPITFKFTSLTDKEIYKYVYLLNYSFPGHITIKALRTEKTKKITPRLLQSIGTDNMVPILDASLEIELRTLVEDPQNRRNISTGEYE